MSGHRRVTSSRSPGLEIALAAIAVPALLGLGYVELRSVDASTATSAAQDAGTDADGTAAATLPTRSARLPVRSPSIGPSAAPRTPAKTLHAEPSPVLDRAIARRLRQDLRAEAEAATLLTTTGPLGEVSAPRGTPVEGDITVSVANIPNVNADARWASSVGTLVAPSPDFVTLNEVYRHPDEGIEAVAPGYTVHRAAGPENTPGAAGQSMNNALLYRSDTWTQLAGGMVKVVDDDRGFLGGRAFLWDRFAVWSVLQRADGAVVSLISTHMPTNPGKYPAQHGNPALSRAALYAQGMDTLVAMSEQLSAYGPVLIGGDMNSHPYQVPWAAAPKLTAAGFEYVKDQGVMYLFFQAAASVVATRQVSIYSDHPALISTIAMNGLGPRS